jgi:UDP-N-acetylmuramoyl-tripeptide--D-alanyl-D-alanine ligase
MKVSIDTRTLEHGDVYIPVKGESFDGRDFIDEAIQKGASRIVDEDIGVFASKYRRRLQCPVIGVTGSFGKTTAKNMLQSVLSQSKRVHATQSNQNNEIGVPLTVLGADASTDVAIVEMGMRRKGEIAYLTRIVRPTHVVITGVGLSHVEFFDHPKQIAHAKSEIFKSKLKWEPENSRYAFLPTHDPYYDLMAAKATAVGYKILPFVSGKGVESNIDLCYAVGRHFGLSDAQIQSGIQTYVPEQHRLVRYALNQGVSLIDDTYNANPDGMRYALGVLKRFKGRKIAVLGDMLELGQFSTSAHLALEDAIIDSEVDVLFTLGDAISVLNDTSLPVTHFQTKSQLISALCSELRDGDALLVKGSRGLKMDDVVNAVIIEVGLDGH